MDDRSLALWLQLREEADHASRSEALTRAVVARLAVDRPVRVLDLATGAGSNIRYLVPRLPLQQEWLAVDRSEELLSRLRARVNDWPQARGVHIDTRTRDLGLLDDPAIFAGRELVTASALLDLVSGGWLKTLAVRCREAGAAALFTITYDGRFSCEPAEPEDEDVRALMNAHQLRDKGLGGPAAGPGAAAEAERRFAEQGYRVVSEASDWTLGPQHSAMQRTLIDGWAEAATEMAPAEGPAIASWRERRLAHVGAARSCIVVGHRDLAAWLE